MNLNKTAVVFMFVFMSLSSLFYPLEAFDNPRDLPQSRIEGSLIHYAVLQAHETGNRAMLEYAIKHESVETRTKAIEIVGESSNDEIFHRDWEEGITPLELAIRLQNPGLVDFLISHGAKCNYFRKEYLPQGVLDVNRMRSRTSYLYTPLYVAILGGNTEIIKKLLDSRANPREIVNTRPRFEGSTSMDVVIDQIYSAHELAVQLYQDHLVEHLDLPDALCPPGLLSTVDRNALLVVRSIDPNDTDESKYKIVLSNGWELLVDDIEEFVSSEPYHLQIESIGNIKDGCVPDFFYIKKCWLGRTSFTIFLAERIIGQAVCVDKSAATYLFVAP